MSRGVFICAARGSPRAPARCASPRPAGKLVYDLDGQEAADEVPVAWLVSVAIDTATQWKELLIVLIQVHVLVLVLHKFDRPSDRFWYEDFLEELSIHAVLFNAPEAASDVAKSRTHAAFHAALEM